MNTTVYDSFLPNHYHGIRAGTPSGPRAASLWCPRVAIPTSAQDPLKTRLRPARYSDSVRAEALKSDFHTTSTNPAGFGAVIRVIITVTTVTNANSST